MSRDVLSMSTMRCPTNECFEQPGKAAISTTLSSPFYFPPSDSFIFLLSYDILLQLSLYSFSIVQEHGIAMTALDVYCTKECMHTLPLKHVHIVIQDKVLHFSAQNLGKKPSKTFCNFLSSSKSRQWKSLHTLTYTHKHYYMKPPNISFC